jgi:hypothetical protein
VGEWLVISSIYANRKAFKYIAMNNPKVNVVGIVFQNNQGERYYSKYYSQHSQLNRAFDLSGKEGQKKFERGLLDKVARMNIISKLKPEESSSPLIQIRFFPLEILQS